MNFHIFVIVAAVMGSSHSHDHTGSSLLSLIDCINKGQDRRPEYSDIAVTCGTNSISLAIQACPIVYTGYNESLMIVNNKLDPACKGTLDISVSPPVVRFSFPLNNTHACGSIFRTTSSAGTGVFSDFSNIQTVNVSGVVRASDPTTGTITYNAEMKYYYSCAYPLEYLINNTQIDVSASSIALTDKNGSFVSTLRIELFTDQNYNRPLVMPQNGIELRTKIYVEVKATNLTGQYNVLLDRCYASISPLPSNSSFFNLIMPCGADDQLTTMIQNGVSQSARFSFPAFRFMEQRNETVSTYYLHCITRLCEVSTCSTFLQCGKRRRRSAQEEEHADDLTHKHTITSPEIVTQENLITAGKPTTTHKNSSAGLGAAVGVLAFVCIVALCIAAVFYKKLRN